MVQAVFSTTIIVWLSSCPECGIPGTAVNPIPGSLHLYVVASQPRHLEDTRYLGISIVFNIFGTVTHCWVPRREVNPTLPTR